MTNRKINIYYYHIRIINHPKMNLSLINSEKNKCKVKTIKNKFK